MELLAASLGALVLGPIAIKLCAGRPAPWQGLDAFVLVSILGLVGLLLLPDALRSGGGWSVLALFLGFWLPSWFERRFHERSRQAQQVTLFLGVLGLALHSLVDGVALVAPSVDHLDHGHHLAYAVLIHRLPVGVTVWWMFRKERLLAVGALMLVAAGTLVGFAQGDALLSRFSPQALSWFQAGLAGSLLHVVVHRSYPGEFDRKIPWAQWIGAACGAAVIAYSLGYHHDHGLTSAFLELAAVSAPALLLGYLGAGLLFAFVPAAGIAWLGRGSVAGQAGRGMLFGLPLPVCSCGVLPLYHSLVRRGVPSAAAFSFLVATPELGLDAIILSLPLLGAPFTGVRVVAAALIAIVVGLILSSVAQGTSQEEQVVRAPATKDRWRAVWRTGFVDVLDETGPWIVFGLAVAALMAAELDLSGLASLPNSIQLPLFALIGLPVYVCASGATPLVAVLIALGVSPGASLVFLLTGPATNVTTFGVLTKLHGRAVAIGFAASVVLSALVTGAMVNQLAIDWRFPEFVASGHEHLNVLEWISLGLLTFLLMGSLWRLGVRGFVSMVLSQTAHDHEHHDHAHHHAHDHEHHHELGCCTHDAGE